MVAIGLMVSSYLQLIEQRADGELTDETREFLDYAVGGADRMRAMNDGLLTYSRVEAQGDPLEPVDLNEVVAAVRADLDVSLAESDAKVIVEDLPTSRGRESTVGSLPELDAKCNRIQRGCPSTDPHRSRAKQR